MSLAPGLDEPFVEHNPLSPQGSGGHDRGHLLPLPTLPSSSLLHHRRVLLSDSKRSFKTIKRKRKAPKGVSHLSWEGELTISAGSSCGRAAGSLEC